MNNFKVDWNDHIGEFIRLKATQPNILTEMLQREQHHSNQKEAQRRLRHLSSQHEKLQSRLIKQLNKLESIENHNAKIRTEIDNLEAECTTLESQLERNSKQLQNRKKTKSSRSSLDATNHTSSERSLPFMRNDLLKKANLEALKHQVQLEVQKCIAHKISLKEEVQKLAKHISEMQSIVRKNIKIAQLKDQIRQNKIKEQKLRQKKHALIERHREKLIQAQKSTKKIKIQNSIMQESSKRLQSFVKQGKKLIFSEKTTISKKYQQFISKYYHSHQVHQIERQLNKLLEKYPELNEIKNLEGSIYSIQDLGRYEELQYEMIKQQSKKQISIGEWNNLDENLRSIQEHIYDLQEKEMLFNLQIQSLKMNLQKKMSTIQQHKKKVKSNRSL